MRFTASSGSVSIRGVARVPPLTPRMADCRPELGEGHRRRVRFTLGDVLQADAAGQRGMGVVRAVSP